MSYWLIWSSGVCLEAGLLFRGLYARLLGKYYLFYIYILSGMIMAVALALPGLYPKYYWQMQMVTLVVGYGILLEVLNHVLAPYPGAERFARFSGILAFAMICVLAFIGPRVMPHWSPGTVIEFERDLRCVQALFIFGLLAVISYYGVPIGRNMKGMVLGYGLYIVTSLMSLAERSYAGPSFTRIWSVVQPLSFDASLTIWLVALWSYCPNPTPDSTIPLEQDYEALVARTKSVMDTIRGYFRKAERA